MQVKFKKLREDVVLPKYATADSAGMDITIPDTHNICLGDRQMIPLGFATQIPEGYFALILPRSSTGAKFGLRLTNTAGVIDADYRGEWHLPITSDKPTLELTAGDCVAQALFLPVIQAEVVETDDLSKTERGEGGFGSTGK